MRPEWRGLCLLGMILFALITLPNPVGVERLVSEEQAAAEVIKRGGNVHRDGHGRVDFVWLTSEDNPDAVLQTLRPSLKALRHLRTLSLYGTRVTGAGLTHLEGLSNIRTLFLERTYITNDDLEQLRGLPNLESLGLQVTRITDEGLKHLHCFPRLRELDLGGSMITDAGLVHLKRLANLQGLTLWGTSVTDAGLEHLRGMTRLRGLFLVYDDAITQDGVQKIRQEMPMVEVTSIDKW